MMKRPNATFLLIPAAALLMLAGCGSKEPEAAKEAKQAEQAPPPAAPPAAKPEEPAAPAKGTYKVLLDTSKGNVVIEVHPEWAPIGAAHFRKLVESGYYDGARFFRVLPGFVAQFGLAASPSVTKKWDTAIKDDPVLQTNRVGSVVYATAGPNTRTTQIFINLAGNQRLDSDGFAPFGMVIQGMEAVQKLYPGYGENPDQGEITARGNAYLTAQFPKLDYIRKATIE
jgi:peptidyl-prolyl cis-trans isomerase A (cyclophilin A)